MSWKRTIWRIWNRIRTCMTSSPTSFNLCYFANPAMSFRLLRTTFPRSLHRILSGSVCSTHYGYDFYSSNAPRCKHILLDSMTLSAPYCKVKSAQYTKISYSTIFFQDVLQYYAIIYCGIEEEVTCKLKIWAYLNLILAHAKRRGLAHFDGEYL